LCAPDQDTSANQTGAVKLRPYTMHRLQAGSYRMKHSKGIISIASPQNVAVTSVCWPESRVSSPREEHSVSSFL